MSVNHRPADTGGRCCPRGHSPSIGASSTLAMRESAFPGWKRKSGGCISSCTDGLMSYAWMCTDIEDDPLICGGYDAVCYSSLRINSSCSDATVRVVGLTIQYSANSWVSYPSAIQALTGPARHHAGVGCVVPHQDKTILTRSRISQPELILT